MNKEDLMKYCGDESRKNISTPFSAGDFTYATNGHVMVRIPRLLDVPERTDAPPTAEHLMESHKGTTYFPIPDIAPIKKLACYECGGTGRFKICPECNGSGFVEFENDFNSYDFTCETCNGKKTFKEGAELECEKCCGTGKITELERVEASGRMYDKKYLLMLKKLPNCQLSEAKQLDPAHFIFDGGEGIIMALKW